MKRIMAIDYGDARTGIAISDLLCSLVGSTTGHHHSWQDLGNGHRVCTVCLETQ